MKKPLIIVTGATATGKTELSIKLAKQINGEIISADSMQVYKHMDIGTAKVRTEEMQGIKHYLIDEIEPTVDFDVFTFKSLADKYIQEIHNKGKIPIIVGGTGFYIQAVLYDIDFTEMNGDESDRQEFYNIAKEQGNEYLHTLLRQVDEEAAQKIHHNNVKRVVRALEYYKQNGRKISEHNIEQEQKNSPYSFAYFVINHEREVLYDRINQRVDKMIECGLVEETKGLLEYGCTSDMTSMKAIGYKEIIPYLCGECTLEEAANKLKQNTRNFAKRQITWFKREEDVRWMNVHEYHNDTDQVLHDMLEITKTL